MPCRILITGANGQLGHDLATELRKRAEVEVHALDREEFDLTKPDVIRSRFRTLQPHLVLNPAAYTAVDKAESDAALAMQINGTAPAILAEECARAGIPLVHYSTDYVFAGDASTPYTESDAVSPASVYGKSKLAGELAVVAIAPQHLVLRVAWLYSNRRANFLHTMLRLARERDRLTVVNDQVGAPTWVRAVTEATLALLRIAPNGATLAVPSGIYHVAPQGQTSWHGFASAILARTSDPHRRATAVDAISSAQFKAAAKRPAYSVLSTEKLAAHGITLPSWESQLDACLAERALLAAAPAADADAGKAAPPIHLFVPTFEVDACLAGIRECLDKGWTGLGYKTIAFEDAWKQYTGLPHAHFLNSATVGLHLAVEVLKRKHGWADDDEIITTPLTFVSDNHAILYAKMKPVFADVDDSLCLDPASVASRISPRTRAVLFVGMGGNCGQYAAVRALCEARGLRLILDAAHMAGTRVAGRHVGHDADATVFSYQAVKNLPTADAGMICFRDAADDELVRKLSWMGINKDTYSRTHSQGNYKWMYDVEHIGFKYHGNSIMAAIGLAQIGVLDRDNERRRAFAAQYRERFAPHPHIRTIPIPSDCESSTHLVQIRVRNRDALLMSLNAMGIYPGVHYRDNIHYRMFAYAEGTCPNARAASDELISLPLHMRLTVADVDRVCDAVIAGAEK